MTVNYQPSTCTLYLGCVPPLLEVALRKFFPLLSVFAVLVHVAPCHFMMSSFHLILGLPRGLLPFLTCRSVVRIVHLLSCILAKCPAHLHFVFVMCFMMLSILVFILISSFGILSVIFIPNIFLLLFMLLVVYEQLFLLGSMFHSHKSSLV